MIIPGQTWGNFSRWIVLIDLGSWNVLGAICLELRSFEWGPGGPFRRRNLRRESAEEKQVSWKKEHKSGDKEKERIRQRLAGSGPSPWYIDRWSLCPCKSVFLPAGEQNAKIWRMSLPSRQRRPTLSEDNYILFDLPMGLEKFPLSRGVVMTFQSHK